MGKLLSPFARLAGVLCRIGWLAFAFLVCAAHAGNPVAGNPVQLENAKAGSTQWQITRLNPDQSAIQGYASLTSVNRGGSIDLYVSTTSPGYTIDIYRIGWYGGAGGRHMLGPISRTGIAQATPAAGAYGLIECDWSDPYTLAIPGTAGDPTDWASGVYLAKLTASSGGWQNYIVFTVRDDSRAPAAAYLFQSSVDTWQAYNNWGGKSLYSFNSSGGVPARKVSFNRPYNSDGSGDFLNWELNMIRFLEREGYDVSYATNVDLHQQGYALIEPHAAFLSVGHDEYWSYQMKEALHEARAHGRHLAFFGADAVYWQVRFEPSTLPAAAPNRTVVGFKEAAQTSDPYWLGGDPAQRKFVTTAFRNFPGAPFNVQDDIAQPENGLVGVMYHGSPFDGDIVVSDAGSWVFSGAGVANGSRLNGLLGYETDAMFNNGFSPPGIETLAESPDHWVASNMTVYTSDAGSVVFAVGTIQWSWGLDDFEPPCGTSRLSAAAQQITRNVLARFAAPPALATGVPAYPLASCGNGQATVSFQPPAGTAPGDIAGYTVASHPAGGIDADAGSTALTHTITGLTNGKTYTFTVTATAAGGATSAPSSATNSVIPASPPAPPYGVAATAGNALATVSFNTPDDGGTWIRGYTVTSHPAGGTDANAGSTATTHTITGLANGTAYSFTVVATNSMGNSAPSNPSNSVTPATVPGIPAAVAATAGDTQASISFSAPASDGGSAITGYTVVSNPAGGVDANAGSSTLTHIVTGLSNGTPYTFTVQAANAVGSGAGSAPSNSVTPAGLPGAPANASASGGDGQASVSFSAAAGNGAAVSGYIVVSNPPGGVDANAGSTALTHLVTNLANGVQYTFKVSASNAVGAGAPSAPSNAVTPAGAPLVSTAAASTVGAFGATLNGMVTANGAATATVFDYGTSAAYGSSGAATPATLAANASATVALSLSGLACNTAYHFRVRAASGAGAANGNDQSFVTAACSGGVPGAPAITSAVAGRGRATIGFAAPATDGGNPIRGYTAACTAPGAVARSATGAGSPITVAGLTGGLTYACTVSAANGIGSGAASDAVAVTPQKAVDLTPLLMLLL